MTSEAVVSLLVPPMAQNGDGSHKRPADDSTTNSSKILKTDNNLPWQLTHATWKDAMSYAFANKLCTDVNFVVGEEKCNIPAMKSILAIRSPVFYVQFYDSSWNTDEVVVPDIEPAAFMSLLKFLYTDDLEDFKTADAAFKVLYAAKKYMVPVLEIHCVEYITKSFWTNKALGILLYADLYKIQHLIDLCYKIIDTCTEEVIYGDDFVNISHELLLSILKRSTLRIDEVHLLKCVFRWASAQCEQQGLEDTKENRVSVSKEALKLIRFRLIDAKQILLSPTVREMIPVVGEVLQNESQSDTEVKRVPTTTRFHSMKSPRPCTGEEEEIIFSISEDAELIGVRFFNSCEEGASTYDLGINFYEFSENTVVYTCITGQTHTCTPCTETKTFVEMFMCPIKVRKNTNYMIQFKMKGPNSFYGEEAVEEVSVPIPGKGEAVITFETTCKQVPELLFW